MAEKPDPRAPQSAPSPDWLERLARFHLHFGRFLRDAAGLSLLALGLMSLLALWQLTGGVLLTPWAKWLSLWFGWGSYLIVAAMGYGGFALLRRQGGRLGWRRLLALELASLLTLGLLAFLGGRSLARAEAGLDGGRLGWGLAYLAVRLARPPGGGAILFFLWLFFIMAGFDGWRALEAWLFKLAGETPSSPSPEAVPRKKSSPQRRATPDVSRGTPAGRGPRPLPPERPPALPASGKKGEKAPRPRPRGEGLPPLNLLLAEQATRPDERTINQTAGLITKTLAEFGIPATVVGYRVGPAVTQFAVQPGFIKKATSNSEEEAQQMKVRVAQIANLQKDLALALSAERLRIEAPVPGKPYVGIEVPNAHASLVRLRPILESEAFHRLGSPLAVALGRDVSGHPVVADLVQMPHLLIAGATGAGKSVCITALAACLAMNNSPQDLRLAMIDSKMVELLRFNGLPHLYGRVETSVERILAVLRWAVLEMEHRYRLLEAARARDLEAYNRKQLRREDGVPLPRIVILIDELADLMMSAPEQTEHHLVRLAQMARATGIHLVVATQRPSTDVVTGLIKANFPARLAFAVASSVDSRVILDTNGAEALLGRGDMLFLNPQLGTPIRAQGVMVTDMEIERIVDYWQKNSELPEERTAPWERLLAESEEDEDEGLIEQAISLVRETQRASASLLQRRLRIGYPRAARLLDQLEARGVVGPPQGGGRERAVLPFEAEEENE